MRQFEVYEVAERGSRTSATLVVVLQADAANSLGAVVVAPLKPPLDAKLPILHVLVNVNGAEFYVRINELAAMPPKLFGRRVANLNDHEASFKRALDFLFFGI